MLSSVLFIAESSFLRQRLARYKKYFKHFFKAGEIISVLPSSLASCLTHILCCVLAGFGIIT